LVWYGAAKINHTRKINQCNPKCQNIDELRTAILQEWQQFPQERLRRLVRSMKGSKITNLRSIYHPERHDYDVAKMGFKTGAGKT
jgi:hypothetical protein